MSEFTFNIADYRPLFAVRAHRAHDARPTIKKSGGIAVLTSNSERRVYAARWLEPRPAVVDIRPVREVNRTGLLQFQPYPRLAKILRFTNQSTDRVYTMATNESASQSDDDPGPAAA
jgi:hypothetical protein